VRVLIEKTVAGTEGQETVKDLAKEFYKRLSCLAARFPAASRVERSSCCMF